MATSTKLKTIEARLPGMPRVAVLVDGVRVGTAEKYRRRHAIVSYRFRLELPGRLHGKWVAFGQKRAQVIAAGVAFAEAYQATEVLQEQKALSASEMLTDLNAIRAKLDKSFRERGGGFGEFTHNEANLSGQRTYLLDKLRDLGFDNDVLHALAFGPSPDWEAF